MDQSGDYLCEIHSTLADPDGGSVSLSVQILRTVSAEHCMIDTRESILDIEYDSVRIHAVRFPQIGTEFLEHPISVLTEPHASFYLGLSQFSASRRTLLLIIAINMRKQHRYSHARQN